MSFRVRVSRAVGAAMRAKDAAVIRARKMAHRMWGGISGKADANSRVLDERFLAHGAALIRLDGVGDGVPDRLVGYRGVCVLVEYKNADGRGRLGANQEIFAELWRGGKAWEAWNLDDVEKLLAAMRVSAARAPLPYQRESTSNGEPGEHEAAR